MHYLSAKKQQQQEMDQMKVLPVVSVLAKVILAKAFLQQTVAAEAVAWSALTDEVA